MLRRGLGLAGPRGQLLLVVLIGLACCRFLLPRALLAARQLARRTRRLSERWCGVVIQEAYTPAPIGLMVGGVAGFLAHSPNGLQRTGWGVLVLVALGGAPWALRAYANLARLMLAPSEQAELELRVAYLAQTRQESLAGGAAELRRIERNLHDGAQARRALALDASVRVQVTGALDGRPPAPVESAAYFAVSELLANVAKHAGAQSAEIHLRHADGALRISVRDDGAGGADPSGGTGLSGVERRLAAFDGVLALSSPPGGPTVITMDVPCALEAPRFPAAPRSAEVPCASS
jgi:hypothetical protein